MTLKNNRAPLQCYFKLCASFCSHWWIQTGVRVRKRLSWVLTTVTLTFDLWPWPFAWTLLLKITPENFMIIRWWEHGEKGVTDGQTDEQTDGRTDGWTDAQNGVLWLLLLINFGAFFLCGYWVLCGCVCMSRPTKRCLVATFVHKFGCLFSCVAIGFVWLQINKIATKVPTVPKNSHRSGVM